MTQITIRLTGPVGCGKTAFMEEVGIALRALGVPVEFADPKMIRAERNATDHTDMLDMYVKAGTTVLLVEEIEGKDALARETQRREQFSEEVECAHMALDDRKAPRMIDGEPLSLVGRIRAALGEL